jgi:HlyD family secretion protein
MNKTARILLAVALLAALGGGVWWHFHRPATGGELTLYGDVDFREASVPFNGSERIAEVLVEEGDAVHKGQVLARLDTSRLLPQLAQAEATVAAQKAVVDRLRNGSRPEEIAQARANLVAARATADVAAAKVAVQQNALTLAVIGSRAEDIAQGEAQLQGYQAQLALIRQQVADVDLLAPFDAVVRSRLMEPGEMASPGKPVFSLATLGTKWVRTYVSESDLGRLHSGSRARIVTDSFPDRPLDGWVGFISPVAEFTPKIVQTADLRTSLVYEVRVFVDDTGNVLRLGMPATVRITADGNGAAGVQALPGPVQVPR